MLSKKCPTNCAYIGTCSKERAAACAYFSEPQIMDTAAAPIAQPIMADIAVKHDYRDIKVGETITITIDLEELKEGLLSLITQALSPTVDRKHNQ